MELILCHLILKVGHLLEVEVRYIWRMLNGKFRVDMMDHFTNSFQV